MKAWLREFLAWAPTPFVVGRDGGWKYRLPVAKPDMTDPVIAAAVERGLQGKAREVVPFHQLIGAGSAKHRATRED